MERYIHDKRTQKSHLKILYYLGHIKKDKFLTKRYAVLQLFVITNLSNLSFFPQNITYFLTRFFYIHFFCIYLIMYLIL
jgi:hypothetical protein